MANQRLMAIEDRMNNVRSRFVDVSKRMADVFVRFEKHQETMNSWDLTAIEDFMSVIESATGVIDHACTGNEHRASSEEKPL